jgi:hypothetical protein
VNRIRLLSILIVLVIAPTWIVVAAFPSWAQDELALEQLQIDLWPEHDRPEMLVIYRGTLATDVPLPATLTFRIPASVGEPSAVAYSDGAENLLTADYSTTINGDWLEVVLDTPEPNFQLEYYDNLERSGDQRTYTFVWPGDHPVEQLSYILLPPPDATDIQTEPELSPFEQGAGASFYGATVDDVSVGQELELTVSYQGGTIVTPEAPSSATNAGDTNLILIAGIAILGVALVIGGVVWYTRQGKLQRSATRPRGPRRRRAPKTGTARSGPGATNYCTKCGRALGTSDRFCGYCGTPVEGKTK